LNNNGLAADAVEKIVEFVVGKQKSLKLRVLQIYNNLLEDEGAIQLGRKFHNLHFFCSLSLKFVFQENY
jgi:hypothetical protein